MPGTKTTNQILRAEAILKTNWLHALNILAEAERDDPLDARIYSLKGDILASRQQYKQAIEVYQKALQLSPESTHLNYVIGNCYFSMNDFRLALVYYNQIQPPPPEIDYNRALALAYLGRHLESVSILKTVVTEGIRNPYFHYLLIEQLIRLKQYPDALFYSELAEDIVGNTQTLSILKATVYNKQKVWLRAYTSYTEADNMMRLILAEHLHPYAISAWQIGQLDKATELLEKTLRIDPFSSAAYEDLLRLLIERDRLNQARKVLADARKHLGRLSPVLLLLQERLLNTGDLSG